MRVAHRNAPDCEIYSLLDFWQIFGKTVFFMSSPLEGESENRRVYIGDLNGGPGWT
jgi:hypothetical protein